MQLSLDTLFAVGASALVAGLSLTAFSRTEPGTITTGWGDGAYQRGFEARFEQSVPTQEASVAFWAALRWTLFNETSAGAVAGQDGWLFTAEEFSEPAATRDLGAELTRVAKLLSRNDIHLVPVIVPDKARIQADRLPRARSRGFEARYDRALATIRDAGLTAIDLRPALASDQSFMRTDTHWSPAGAKAVARTLSDHLADLPLAPATVTTKATGQTAFEGDLLAFVATGAHRATFGPAPETIRTFETRVETTESLFGDAEIPVALVGTSYSAKTKFHFEGFLKTALQADVLNASTIGQGPFAPMDSFLNDLPQLTALPTLVIWEIPERYLTTRTPKS